MTISRNLILALICIMHLQGGTVTLHAQTVATFEALPLEENTFWNGSEMPNGATFANGNVIFHNFFDTSFGGFWIEGWAYSNVLDTTTVGFPNLYSSITGSGFLSPAYGVGTYNAVLRCNEDATGKGISGVYVSNATIAVRSMEEGDAFAKKFGGPSGDDPDWFKLTVGGWFNGAQLTNTVELYLADYRFADNAQDYILKHWEWLDLTPLGNVDSLIFLLSSSDTGLFGMNTPYYFVIDDFTTTDQAMFAPAAGVEGTSAIAADSSVFAAWATGCTVQRGYQDISDPGLGFASAGENEFALDVAGINGVVSLGDGGSATLTFDQPIRNGDGWDFAVFENSFSDTYLELAFVEVSSDGSNFFRFPASSYTPDSVQVDGFGSLHATHIDNFAGKYRALFGTPFDLEQLASEPGLNVQSITHVRIVDVVGSILPEFATYDQYGNVVNDPWSTPFPSGGFDLDAVGVIHVAPLSVNDTLQETVPAVLVYPQPAHDKVCIELSTEFIGAISLSSVHGKIVYHDPGPDHTNTYCIDVSELPAGTYFVSLTSGKHFLTQPMLIVHE